MAVQRTCKTDGLWVDLRQRLGIGDWTDAKASGLSPSGKLSLSVSNDVRWYRAIGYWEIENNQSQVYGLLANDTVIPVFARQWIADALSGRIKRKRGPRSMGSANPGIAIREMVRQVEIKSEYRWRLNLSQRMKEAGEALGCTPTEQALADTAERFSMTEDAVSHVVSPRKARISRKRPP